MNTPLNAAKKEKIIIINWLIEHFPNAFFKKGSQVKPLKIGIYEDIIEFYDRLDTPSFSKKNLKDAISYYSNSPFYLTNQKANTPRVDMFGNEVDVVTEEQAKYAFQRYQMRYKKDEQSEAG